MPSIIVSNITSLDSYYEGPNGMLDLPMDAAFDDYNLERINAAGTVILGANTYAAMVGYWPYVHDHPGLPDDDPMSRAYSENNRAISRRYDEVDILVVSDSTTVAPSSPWRSHTRVVSRAGAKEAIGSLLGECVVFGSRTLWNELLAEDLIDEVHLMVGSTALCGGAAVFTRPVTMELIDTRTFDHSSNVLHRYRPTRSDG